MSNRAEKRREKKEMEKKMKRFFKANEDIDFLFSDFVFADSQTKTQSECVCR